MHAILFATPRTPKGYKYATEPESPLARYSKPTPPELPSLRYWKESCSAMSNHTHARAMLTPARLFSQPGSSPAPGPSTSSSVTSSTSNEGTSAGSSPESFAAPMLLDYYLSNGTDIDASCSFNAHAVKRPKKRRDLHHEEEASGKMSAAKMQSMERKTE